MSSKHSSHHNQNNDFNNAIQLDSQFDQHLASMKKHILVLSDKQSKQNCALWIKKLCDISDTPNIITKQIRNSYSYNLLRNLEASEQLTHPFNEKPPSGNLNCLNFSSAATHTEKLTRPYSQNLNNTSNTHNTTQNTSSHVQDIKRLNLESATSSSNDSQNFKSSNNDRKSVFDERDYNSSYSETIDQCDQTNDQTISQKIMNFNSFKKDQINDQNYNQNGKREPLNNQHNNKIEYNNHQIIDNSDLQNFVQNMNQQNENQKISLEKQKNFQIQQLEFHIKKLESKYHEEKLDAQHQHNLEIQKIMDRKNSEQERLKKEHRHKIKNDEELINALERKLSQAAKQLSAMQIECDRKINELTNETSHILEMNQKESENKFKDLFYKNEKEKSDLQQQHTQAFQVLVEETNARLKKVEAEYNEQQLITDKVVKELESRTELLKNEMAKNLKLIEQLEIDKKMLQQASEKLEKQINEVQKKSQASQSKLKENHNQELDNNMKKSQSVLNDTKLEFQKNIEAEVKKYEELEKTKNSMEKKNQKLVNLLREKDFYIENLRETLKKQEIQAEDALNEIKDQVELNSKKIYEEMEVQMGRCETDLARSKSLREKQTKETQKQIEKVKSQHEKELHKLRNEFNEIERSLKNEFDEERRMLVKQNSETIAELQEKSIENNYKYQNRIENLTSTICQQDLKMSELQREIAESNSLRKNQIIELGILREDEKLKLIREKELQVEVMKSEMETFKKTIKEDNARVKEDQKEEIKNLLFTSNQEKKNLSELIAALEENNKNLKLENQRILQINEQNLKEAFSRLESEKNTAKKLYQSRIHKLEKEIEFVKKAKEQIEFQMNMANSDYENSLTKLKMHYEERQKGLLPQDIKQEFEETISSLKSQVQILQQRTSLLQSELDDRNHLINSSSCTASI